MKAIYIGAGLDISPIEILPNNINEYYFIDSLPYSEKGKETFILPNDQELEVYTNSFLKNIFLSSSHSKNLEYCIAK